MELQAAMADGQLIASAFGKENRFANNPCT
jgi:hypothetical protein